MDLLLLNQLDFIDVRIIFAHARLTYIDTYLM